MDKFFVNKNSQPNGDHEVHKEGCNYMPDYYNRIDLGYHSNCQSAVRKAKEYYNQSNGCYYCCKECHTS